MLELISPTQMGAADRAMIGTGKITGIELMNRAGAAVAQAVQTSYPAAKRVTIFCGPGNNGGDGFVVARLLKEQGFDVRVLCTLDGDQLTGDAAQAVRAWDGAILPIDAEIGPCDIVIDALLGAGLTRDVSGAMAAIITRIGDLTCPIIAIDLPSGIDGANGMVRGRAVHANLTITFGRLKPGHMLLPGRQRCGTRILANIGITDETFSSLGVTTFANRPALWRDHLPKVDPASHKYKRGHVGVVSGPRHATGAARLAVRAAQRAGTGLVTAFAEETAADILGVALESAMVRVANGSEELGALIKRGKISSVVIGPGCGVGEATRARVSVLAGLDIALVLDADALTSFECDAGELKALLAARSKPAVLTPHAGEFTRLFGKMHPDGKLAASLEAARNFNAVVVFKGADTVVAAPDGRAAIADNAPPWLATAGAGDVLSGLIAGLLAQGIPAFEAASAAVWIHGEAAALAGEGLIAEDLPDRFPLVLDRIRPSALRWFYRDPLQTP